MASGLQNQHPARVRFAEQGVTMGDNHYGGVPTQAPQRFYHAALVAGVQLAGRFVKHEQRGLRNSGLECESDTDYNPLRAEFPAIFGPTSRMVSRFGRCPPHSYRIWILDEICVPK